MDDRIEFLKGYIEYLKEDNTKNQSIHIIKFNNKLIQKSESELEYLVNGKCNKCGAKKTTDWYSCQWCLDTLKGGK